MSRSGTLTGVSLAMLLVAAPALAQAGQEREQEQEGPLVVRESYYQVSFADLETWNRTYREHVVPVLSTMVEEGIIEGWGAWSHDTGGGPYNWRLAMRFFPDADLGAGVDTFTSRLGRQVPAETMEETRRMIRRHEDQIWTAADVWFREGVPPEGPAPRIYVASFQVNPADLESWNGFYRDVWAPALRGSAEAGQLGGWVVLEHAHGGPYNWKIMYFAPDWDSLDDVWSAAFEAFGEDEQAWMETLRMIEAHDDAIWTPVGQGQ